MLLLFYFSSHVKAPLIALSQFSYVDALKGVAQLGACHRLRAQRTPLTCTASMSGGLPSWARHRWRTLLTCTVS